jgi:CRP/FNR family cyclic AMP-dependent transcriptional regulator
MTATTLESLRKVPVFREVDHRYLAELAALARARTFAAGTTIVRQGDPGDSVFVIKAGFLKVHVSGPSGAITTLGMMGAGEIFGELSLLDGGPRSATVTALTRAELISLEREPFLRTLEARPRTAIAVLEVIARRLRLLSERSDDIATMNLGSRLAKQLLLLATNHGHALGPGRLRLGVKLSQREIGELVGATRESVNKHLGLWKHEGVVGEESGYLVIRQVEVLRTMAAA